MCKNKTEHHCGFCNMYFKSQLTFDRHQVTPTHLASVKRGGPIVKITFCDTCQIDLSSPKYLRRHLKSEVHQKKLDKLKLLEHLNNRNSCSCNFLTLEGKHICFYYTQELHAAYHYDLLVKEHKLEYCTPINNIPKPKDFVKKEKDPNKLPQGVGFDIKTQKYYYTF